MKPFIIFLLIVTVGFWGWTGYRTVAFATARLGSVTLDWKNVRSPQTHLAWSPSQSAYHFAGKKLELPPESRATFLLKSVGRFTRGQIQFATDGTAQIQVEGIATLSPISSTPSIDLDWFQARRVPSGYPITIINPGSQSVLVSEIAITLRP